MKTDLDKFSAKKNIRILKKKKKVRIPIYVFDSICHYILF